MSATLSAGSAAYPSATRDTARAAVLVDAGIITPADACEHKASFRTKNEARGAAKSVMRKTGRRTTTYRCPWGDHYHVTKCKHLEGEADERREASE